MREIKKAGGGPEAVCPIEILRAKYLSKKLKKFLDRRKTVLYNNPCVTVRGVTSREAKRA